MSIMFPCACPKARLVSPVRWYAASWWPQSTFENTLHQYPELEVLGPFLFNKGDARSKAYFLPQTVFILTLFLSYRGEMAQAT